MPGCPAAAAQEHLSAQPDTIPAELGWKNPAALPGLCLAGVVLRGWQTSVWGEEHRWDSG